MIAALLLLALHALPAAAERRYRVEIAGEHAGWAALSIACAPEGCRAGWRSALLAPADAGGRLLERRIEMETGPGGEARRVSSWRGAGEPEVRDGPGPIPASLAEVVLSAAGQGERRCVTVREEESGRAGQACARREGEWLAGEVLGARERFRARPGEPPEEVELPDQRARFVADPGAALPARPPRLFGAEVARAGGTGLPRFCGREQEPPPLRPPARAPGDWPAGASCREKTSRWLEAAARAGLEGRHVVGVAWDGGAFVWHEWAEVRTAAGWAPVDPAFRQSPAAGPRFALARYATGDRQGEARAGEAVLGCWGRARVEGGR